MYNSIYMYSSFQNILVAAILTYHKLMQASKGILNLPTSSLHLCSPFQHNS